MRVHSGKNADKWLLAAKDKKDWLKSWKVGIRGWKLPSKIGLRMNAWHGDRGLCSFFQNFHSPPTKDKCEQQEKEEEKNDGQ